MKPKIKLFGPLVIDFEAVSTCRMSGGICFEFKILLKTGNVAHPYAPAEFLEAVKTYALTTAAIASGLDIEQIYFVAWNSALEKTSIYVATRVPPQKEIPLF